MIDPTVGTIVVLGMAVLLAFAAAHKFRVNREFGEILTAYRLMPAALVPAVSRGVPALELLIAVGLLIPASRDLACFAAAALLLAYAGAIGINLARGRRELDCGCSLARGRRSIASWMVARNGVLAVAVAAMALPWTIRSLTWIDMTTIVAGATAAALLYAAIDALLGRVGPAAAMARAR